MKLSNEQRLIAILLKTPNIIDDYDYINSSHIMNDLNRDLFQTIINMRNKDEFITPHTLKQYLANKNDSHNYIDFLSNSNIDVREFESVCKQQVNTTIDFNLNALQQSLNNIRNKEGIDTNEKLQEVEEVFKGFIDGSDTHDSEAFTLKDAFKSFMTEVTTGVYIKPTFGFNKLDEYCPTSNNPGEMTIVGARPGMGKTIFMQSIYKNAAVENKKVVVFSTEMPKEQLISRLMSELLEIDSKLLHSRKVSPSEINSRISKNEEIRHIMKKIEENVIFYDKEITVEEIRQECRKIKRKKGLDIILVDYLQRLGTFKKFGAGHNTEKTGYISNQLKSIAKSTKSAMYCLTQLNRACEDRQNKRPIASDLKQSGDIEQDASLIIMIYRDSLYDENSSIKNYVEFIIPKNRHGETGTVVVRSDLKHSRFIDIQEDEEKKVIEKIKELTSPKNLKKK